MALTKPLRQRLIDQGLIRPNAVQVETYAWRDRFGRSGTGTYLLLENVERLRAKLIELEILVPGSELAPGSPIQPRLEAGGSHVAE